MNLHRSGNSKTSIPLSEYWTQRPLKVSSATTVWGNEEMNLTFQSTGLQLWSSDVSFYQIEIEWWLQLEYLHTCKLEITRSFDSIKLLTCARDLTMTLFISDVILVISWIGHWINFFSCWHFYEVKFSIRVLVRFVSSSWIIYWLHFFIYGWLLF